MQRVNFSELEWYGTRNYFGCGQAYEVLDLRRVELRL
jgi:hypothetical protein